MLSALLLVACLAANRAEDPPTIQPVRYELDLKVDVPARQLSGTARVTVVNKSSRPATELSLLLYRLMHATAVRSLDKGPTTMTQRVVEFEDFPALQVRQVLVRLSQPLKPNERTTLEIEYEGLLRGYAETGMLYVRDRIDTAYTLIRPDAFAYPSPGYPSERLRHSAGLPEFDYDARVTVPDGFTVANLGRLAGKTSSRGWTTFEYRNLLPAWRMDFGIARFGVLERDGLRVFHLREDSAGATRLLGVMEQTLSLYTRWFGPRVGAASFTVMEIPEGWGSQADESGIIQTANAFRQKGHDFELYHELSHLWNVKSTENPSPRWNEGLASFLEDVTTDTLQGRTTTDSAAQALVTSLKRRVTEDTLLARVPMIEYGRKGITGGSYSVGALMFYMLYRVMGHDAFSRAIDQYYHQYVGTGGNTADFIRVAQRVAGQRDLSPIFQDWLYTTRWTEVLASSASVGDVVRRYMR